MVELAEGPALAAIHGRRDTILRPVAIAQPAAGAEWTITVPGYAYWRVLSIAAQLTASAVAASRSPRINVASSEGIFLTCSSPSNQTANQIVTYCVANFGLNAILNNNRVVLGMPLDRLWLQPGWTIKSQTTQIDAGDQWANIIAYVEEREIQGAGAEYTREQLELQRLAATLEPYRGQP